MMDYKEIKMTTKKKKRFKRQVVIIILQNESVIFKSHERMQLNYVFLYFL